MSAQPDLDAFLAALPEERRAGARSDLAVAQALSSLLDAATAGWSRPGDRAGLAAHVARKVEGGPVVEALGRLHAVDLGVAFGAVAGDPGAVAELDRTLARLDGALVKLGMTEEGAREVRQSIAASVPLPRDARPAELLDYSGRGPLGAWLRVVGLRQAQRTLKRERRNVALDDGQLADRIASAPDIVAAVTSASHREAVAQALRDAIATLDSQQKSLLRFQLLDGLGVSELGAVYGVHRATAARWVAQAREALCSAMRRLLAERLAVAPDEIESVVRMVDSQIDVSLARLLVEPDSSGRP